MEKYINYSFEELITEHYIYSIWVYEAKTKPNIEVNPEDEIIKNHLETLIDEKLKISNFYIIMQSINSVSELTDDDLILLNEKYQEKLTRYKLMMNETTERTEKIIHRIQEEQIRRYVNKHLQNFIESKMDLSN